MATSTTTAPTAPAPAAVPAAAPRVSVSRITLGVPIALAVLALAALVVGAVTGAYDTTSGGTVRVAPRFSLESVRDRSVRVTLGAGGQPTVVNFFAAWCVPCRAELPVLQRASQRLAGSVAFVGVDVADSRTAAGELLDRTGVTFPAGYDPDRKVASRYRVQGMPTTVFVDAGGRVTEVARGRLTASELDRRLARLTAGSRVAGSRVGREGPS